MARKRTKTTPDTRQTLIPLGLILAVVGFGLFLIEEHHTLPQTLTGLALWMVAMAGGVRLLKPVPGAPLFSQTSLRDHWGKKEWGWSRALLLGAVALVALKIANESIEHRNWYLLAIGLATLGGVLSLSQARFPSFWKRPLESPGPNYPPWWHWVLIGAVGSFFLFYRFSDLPLYGGGEPFNTLVGGKYFADGNLSTPFIDIWEGNPYLPSLFLALVVKTVGFSYLAGNALFALINLAGVFFLYGVFGFFLERRMALITTLLFAGSHWVLFMARWTFEGASIVVPFYIATLYFFLRAVEKGMPRDFVLFGLLLAGTMNTYMSSRYILVFFFSATIILWTLKRKALAGQGRLWVLAWGVFLLWYMPMILYYLHNQGQYLSFGFSQRMAEINVLGICRREGNYQRFWENVQQGLQMFTVKTTDDWTQWFPFLSPWEGLCLLTGIAWCLWRILKPIHLLILLGFVGGMCTSVLSNTPTHSNRALAGSPFVYLLIGIGLDQLGSLILAPLGTRGKSLRWAFNASFVALSLAWQYDIYFHQMPKTYKPWVSGSSGNVSLAGKVLRRYPQGWDLYIPGEINFTYQVYAPVGQSLGNVKIFYPCQDFPIAKIPAKGALLLFTDTLARSCADWIQAYYPDVEPRKILNPFGETQLWSWEITPEQVRRALVQGHRSIPTGVSLQWFDAKDRKLGQWQVPDLSLGTKDWMDNVPCFGPFPSPQIAYFKVSGMIHNEAGKILALESSGDLDWTLGGKKVQAVGPRLNRLEITPEKDGWVPFRIRYAIKARDYRLILTRLDPDGWDTVPTRDLRP